MRDVKATMFKFMCEACELEKGAIPGWLLLNLMFGCKDMK
jgi:hypothetical protein